MTVNTSSQDCIRPVSRNLLDMSLDLENVILHSRLKDFEKNVPDSGLSIKMCVRGEEHYFIDKEKHTISPDRFLVVNRHQQFDCQIRSDETVEAFCIYLGKSLILEVMNDCTHSLDEQLSAPGCMANHSPVFLEKVFYLDESELGVFLRQLRPRLLSNQTDDNIDFTQLFYNIAEKLIHSQMKIDDQLQRIPSARMSTRKELYRRLSVAHNYIQDNYTNNIQLDKLARVALLSKFHLLRTYKQVYGITPYKHVLKMRLKRSRELMQEDRSFEEIAFQLGFSDRRSFTKAFKKMYGVAPSQYRGVENGRAARG